MTALRGIASGAIWPLGREHACDLAQIRQSERDRDAQAAEPEVAA